MEKQIDVGDTVKVKEGIMCPDFEGLEIGGWQGSVQEIAEDDDGRTLILIEWDEDTLKNMSEAFLENSEEEGLDYTQMYLYQEEISVL